MGKPLYTARQFINAMPGSGGIYATIAKRVGCDYATVKKYIANYPTVAQAYEAECETVTDMAVSVVIKSIQDGNTQDAKWWLARKRRSEFSERVELTGAEGASLFDLDRLTDEQLAVIATGGSPKAIKATPG